MGNPTPASAIAVRPNVLSFIRHSFTVTGEVGLGRFPENDLYLK
jgi:hypothetical protein